MTINIKGLTVEFNNGTKAIDNLNLNIEKGIYTKRSKSKYIESIW